MAHRGGRTALIVLGLAGLGAGSWVYANQGPATAAAPNATLTPAAAALPAAPKVPPVPATAAPAARPGTAKPLDKGAKPVDKLAWSQLSKPQQQALMPLAGEWDKLEGVRKQKWLEIANRFASMKPDEQARVHERMREWIKLTPEQRRVVRENYARSKKIEPSRKTEQWERYQQLPEEQKQKLAADAATKKQLGVPPSAAQRDLKPIAPLKTRGPQPHSIQSPLPANSAPASGNAAAPAPAPPAQPETAPAAVAPAAPPGSTQ
jgi:hypothetical protein